MLLNIKSLNDKLKEIEKHKSEDENLVTIVSSLQNTISSYQIEIQDLKKSNKTLTDENNTYKDMIEKLKQGPFKQETSSFIGPELADTKNITKTFTKDEKTDSNDRALKDYMKEAGIPNPFIKISEGVYSYSSKKISLSLKNGIPVIRVGGGYMFIDEFLKIYNGQAKKKTEDEQNTERSLSLEGKMLKNPVEKFVEELDVENFPDLMVSTPSTSPLKKKLISGIVYPTKSAILRKIPRLNNSNRELTPNSRRNRTPRQVFLP